jgi:hypothetical protein
VATNIHLDQSSFLRKKWYPLHLVPPLDEEISIEFGPGEPLALVQELPFFDYSIKLDPLLSHSLYLCVHNMIARCILDAVGFELCWCQLLCYV